MKDLGITTVGTRKDGPDLDAALKKQVEDDGGLSSHQHKENVLQSREEVFDSVNTSQMNADGEVTFEIPPSKNGKVPRKKLVLKEPGGSAQFRATAMLPSDMAGNGALVQMIQSLLYIKSIDGVLIDPPQTYRQAQGLADRIGDEGLFILNCMLEESYPASDETRAHAKRIAVLRNL